MLGKTACARKHATRIATIPLEGLVKLKNVPPICIGKKQHHMNTYTSWQRKQPKEKNEDFMNVQCKRHKRLWTIGFTIVGSICKLSFTLSKVVKICTNGSCYLDKSGACRLFQTQGCYTLWSTSILKFIIPFNVNIGFLVNPLSILCSIFGLQRP